MLARVHGLDRLVGVHLRRRAQDHRIDIVAGEHLFIVGGGEADAVFLGHGLRRFEPASDQRGHFHAIDVLQSVEVLFTECAAAGECDLHGVSPYRG